MLCLIYVGIQGNDNKLMIMTVEKDDNNRNNECHGLKIEDDHHIDINMTCLNKYITTHLLFLISSPSETLSCQRYLYALKP